MVCVAVMQWRSAWWWKTLLNGVIECWENADHASRSAAPFARGFRASSCVLLGT